MKTKYLYIIAIAAVLAAGCKKEKPLSPKEQQDSLEGMGMELIEYADVENWGESFKAVAQFEKVINDKQNDRTIFDTISEGIATEEENEIEDKEYGWYCTYKEPGEFVNEEINTIQFANAKGAITLDAEKKAWVKADAPKLTVTADVEGTIMTAEAEIKTSATKTLIIESSDEYYNIWPAYTTGPAMEMEKVKHEQENYSYYSWEPVTRTTEGVQEHHFYNPVDKTDYGWISETQFNDNYNNYMNMVSVPEGKRSQINVYRTYLYVPESITASFRKGNETIGDLTIGIDYKPASAGKFDISKDQTDVTFSFSAAGYTLKTKKLNYLTDGAEASYVFSYGKKDIFTMTAKESGFKVSSEVKEKKSERDNGDGYKNGSISTNTRYDISSTPTTAEISFDLLGELQVKGTADVEAIIACSDSLDAYRTNENEFKRWLKQAENAFKLQAFYDSKKCSAHLGLEPEWDKEEGEWEAIPVIRFDDGSSFAMFEDFFNKTDFADLIKAYEDWKKGVDSYIDSVLNKKQ